METSAIKIMIVAGEASGDLHASKLVRALRESSADRRLEFFGAAGPLMRDAGVEAIVGADHLSVVGLLEIGRALPMFWSAFRQLKDAANQRGPDVAVLVDFPDFNLKLAKALKKRGFRVVYYISPQLWAWRKYRIRTIRKHVDLVLSILPFEKDWYAAQGVNHVRYVGSPLAREVHPEKSKAEFCSKHGLDPLRPIVALLPGSRHKEIVRILPDMLKSTAEMSKTKPDLQFAIALAEVRSHKEVEQSKESVLSSGVGLPEVLLTVQGETFDLLNAADAAAVTSGTATLESGIIGTPMAIVYKTSALNYKLLRPLIDVEHFGLINLIAETRVAKELIQGDFTPETLANELFSLLKPAENAEVRSKLKTAADRLGRGGASKRAAESILELLSKNRT
jgi:lipid-A-disaccharide synthase